MAPDVDVKAMRGPAAMAGKRLSDAPHHHGIAYQVFHLTDLEAIVRPLGPALAIRWDPPLCDVIECAAKTEACNARAARAGRLRPCAQ